MCYLHSHIHSCGCRDASRVVVCDRMAHHVADHRCHDLLASPRRRPRYCARHVPTYTPAYPPFATWEYREPFGYLKWPYTF